ncbi:MAG TPA: hypothetical protein VFK02_33285 [Kofleriaceae bacterium]|nr:hypothetical protein [Kofleriaceae bacterium]
MVAPLDTSEQVGSESKLLRIQRSEADRLELLQRLVLTSVIGGRQPCLGEDESRRIHMPVISAAQDLLHELDRLLRVPLSLAPDVGARRGERDERVLLLSRVGQVLGHPPLKIQGVAVDGQGRVDVLALVHQQVTQVHEASSGEHPAGRSDRLGRCGRLAKKLVGIVEELRGLLGVRALDREVAQAEAERALGLHGAIGPAGARRTRQRGSKQSLGGEQVLDAHPQPARQERVPEVMSCGSSRGARVCLGMQLDRLEEQRVRLLLSLARREPHCAVPQACRLAPCGG